MPVKRTYVRREFENKKSKAKRLFLQTNLTGNEIAQKVETSVQTISRWNKMYGWAKFRKERIFKQQSSNNLSLDSKDIQLLKELETFAWTNFPYSFSTIRQLINDFRKHINKQKNESSK